MVLDRHENEPAFEQTLRSARFAKVYAASPMLSISRRWSIRAAFHFYGEVAAASSIVVLSTMVMLLSRICCPRQGLVSRVLVDHFSTHQNKKATRQQSALFAQSQMPYACDIPTNIGVVAGEWVTLHSSYARFCAAAQGCLRAELWCTAQRRGVCKVSGSRRRAL